LFWLSFQPHPLLGSPVPAIDPLFGHELIYNIGYGTGVVVGIALDIMNEACATATTLQKAAKIYTL
jgi:hypothetical protein